MKLVRYGAIGRERPGMIDAAGRIRDLSKIVSDIADDTLSPKSLAKASQTQCQGTARRFVASDALAPAWVKSAISSLSA